MTSATSSTALVDNNIGIVRALDGLHNFKRGELKIPRDGMILHRLKIIDLVSLSVSCKACNNWIKDSQVTSTRISAARRLFRKVLEKTKHEQIVNYFFLTRFDLYFQPLEPLLEELAADASPAINIQQILYKYAEMYPSSIPKIIVVWRQGRVSLPPERNSFISFFENLLSGLKEEEPLHWSTRIYRAVDFLFPFITIWSERRPEDIDKIKEIYPSFDSRSHTYNWWISTAFVNAQQNPFEAFASLCKKAHVETCSFESPCCTLALMAIKQNSSRSAEVFGTLQKTFFNKSLMDYEDIPTDFLSDFLVEWILGQPDQAAQVLSLIRNNAIYLRWYAYHKNTLSMKLTIKWCDRQPTACQKVLKHVMDDRLFPPGDGYSRMDAASHALQVWARASEDLTPVFAYIGMHKNRMFKRGLEGSLTLGCLMVDILKIWLQRDPTRLNEIREFATKEFHLFNLENRGELPYTKQDVMQALLMEEVRLDPSKHLAALKQLSQQTTNPKYIHSQEMRYKFDIQSRTGDCGAVLTTVAEVAPEQGKQMLSLLSNATYFPADDCVPTIAFDIISCWIRAFPIQAAEAMSLIYDKHLFPDLEYRYKAVYMVVSAWIRHESPTIRAFFDTTNQPPEPSWSHTAILKQINEEDSLADFILLVSLCLTTIILDEGYTAFNKTARSLGLENNLANRVCVLTLKSLIDLNGHFNALAVN